VTPELAVGLVLALASAAALNWGFFAQHEAAAALPRLEVRSPLRSLLVLFRTSRWTIGFATGIGGWALYVAALRLAPLSLVQAASAGGIGLLALFVSRAGGRMSRRERAGVGLAVAGLALLAVSLAGHGGGGGPPAATSAVVLWLVGSGLVALLAVGPGERMLAPGAGFGVAAGVLYAAGDVATKAAVAGSGLAFVAFVLVCHGGAFVVLQLGFQRGGVLATVGVATLFTNALPIAAGTTIFNEGVPAGVLGGVRIVAFAATVVGAAALARGGEPRARVSDRDIGGIAVDRVSTAPRATI